MNASLPMTLAQLDELIGMLRPVTCRGCGSESIAWWVLLRGSAAPAEPMCRECSTPLLYPLVGVSACPI